MQQVWTVTRRFCPNRLAFWRGCAQFTAVEKKKLEEAIDDDYYFEFVMDKLPMWGAVRGIARGTKETIKPTQSTYMPSLWLRRCPEVDNPGHHHPLTGF